MSLVSPLMPSIPTPLSTLPTVGIPGGPRDVGEASAAPFAVTCALIRGEGCVVACGVSGAI